MGNTQSSSMLFIDPVIKMNLKKMQVYIIVQRFVHEILTSHTPFLILVFCV